MIAVGILMELAYLVAGEAVLAGVISAAIFAIAYIPMLYFLIIFAIRRFHDMGMSGWFVLLFFVPIVNIILGLVMILKAGDPDTN